MILVLQVAGELRLACGWYVTPSDVAAMRLRAALQEAEHKEEVAALLLERVIRNNGHRALDTTTSLRRRGDRGKALTGSGHAGGRSASAAPQVSLPMLRGRLDIKVSGRKFLRNATAKSRQAVSNMVMIKMLITRTDMLFLAALQRCWKRGA